MSILEELKWRGLVADCTDAVELEKKIAAPITLYCGFDPTADSLHVGNLVPLGRSGGPLLREWVDDARATPQDLDALAVPDEQGWLSEREEALRY